MKRGSALLVVLGMLAFMLFSGLAFSVYMRQSRLPTSFLRRTVTTRQLAKAALAEAIEEIDTAIANDPHPNVHIGAYQSGVVSNVWNHRIFVGAGSSVTKNNSQQETGKDIHPVEIDPSETVPTLTLEGLAYLPPNLINEARYYSQRTPTAKWDSFWFDSGRYAYTAIDVSDYFDINRVYANKPRSSGNRISLAHLFETISVGGGDGASVAHTGAGSGAKDWDGTAFMEELRNKYSDLPPLVSLAHFNVEWNQNGAFDFGGDSIASPFSSFLKNGNAYTVGETGSAMERYRMMTFVTDGWFPTTTGNTTPDTNREKRDLTQYQPFRDDDLNGSTMPSMVDTIMGYSSDIVNSEGKSADLMQHLCGLGLVQLWDYLDVNRVPVSLAVPTLERVPMIVGIEPTELPDFAITRKVNDKDNDAEGEKADKVETEEAVKQTSTRTVVYYISPKGIVADCSPGVSVVLAYPFRAHGIDEDDTFDVDGRIEVFFSNDQMNLRAENAVDALHVNKDDRNEMQGAGIRNNSVISIPLSKTSIPVKDIVKQGGAKQIGLRGNTQILEVADDLAISRITYKWISKEWDASANDGQGAWITGGPLKAHKDPTNADIEDATWDFWPLTKDGSCNSMSSDKVKELLRQGRSISEARVNASVRVRVKYKDEVFGDKTVDLVPACVLDDEELNDARNNDSQGLMIGGEAYPLMRFNAQIGDGQAQQTLSFSLEEFNRIANKPQKITLPDDGPRKIICNDPRYNHQPENWYMVSGTEIKEQDWLDETAKMLGQGKEGNKCDSDFYMFTSDAGYMQSVYELAFLPRLTGLTYETKVNGFWGNYPTSTTLPSSRNTFAAKASEAKDYDVMWRTYRCYDSNGNVADPFEEIGLTCGENGPKVNPYSDSTKVLAAAFANTPHDWRVTTTNKEYAIISDDEMDDAAAFNKKHAWNDYSSDNTGKMCWECVEAVAKEFKAKVRKAGDWEDAFADLIWDRSDWTSEEKPKHIIDFEEPENDDFTEDADSPMYSVDKKFLYGFWHDSFSARQQLFLIFVRAEPMMMGGGLSGQVPPQLSARAVALVWRDPAKTAERSVNGGDNSGGKRYNPHRTRILFYHQFD